MQGKHAKHARTDSTQTAASASAENLSTADAQPTEIIFSADDGVQPASLPIGAGAESAEETAALEAQGIPDAEDSIFGSSAEDSIFDFQIASDEAHAASPEEPEETAAAVPPVAPPGVSAAAQQSASSAAQSESALAATASGLSVIDPETGGYVNVEPKKKGRLLKPFLITLGIIVGVLAVTYGVGAYMFSQKFLPNTSFGDVDVSMMAAEDLQKMIEDKVAAYQLDVVGGAFSYRATAKDLGLSVDSAKMAEEMLQSQNQWAWPYLLLQGRQEVSSDYALTYNKDKLDSELLEKVTAYNEGATPPTNATVAYNESSDAFVVQPEVVGTQYQPQAVVDAATEAVASLTPLAALQPDQLIQPTITADDPKLVTAAEEATKMVSTHLHFRLDGHEGGEIGPDDLHDLIRFDDDLNVSLDEDGLNVWIDGVVKRYNTVGSERHYTRPDGKEITVSGGEYGWEVDEDGLRQIVLDAIYAGESKDVDVPCWSIAQAFNGVGQPDWNKRYADVDLSEQYVRFYDDDGELIWESPCITGVPDGEHNTVEGVWSVNNKESPSKLIGRDRNGKKEYETMVQYWMAFEQNSIGFHDATWQPSFGGDLYRQGYGSHGCVNLPYSAAEELYSLIDWDDVVIVHW